MTSPQIYVKLVITMVKKNSELKKFEHDFIKKSEINIEKNLEILDSLYREAIFLDRFKTDNPLDGIESRIKIARTVNSV